MFDKFAGKKIVAFLFFIVSIISGCQKQTANSTVNNLSRNEPGDVAKANQYSDSNSKIKLFNGKGIVTKINLELGSVELNHEAIEGAMPAMIMEFYVREKTEIKVLKVEDKVEFVLEENFGQERIASIKKIQ